MLKNEVEINEINKLYDEIYYGTFGEVESALDILTNCISEKEYQEFEFFPKVIVDIMEIIIDLYDEVIEILDDEGISEIKTFIADKKDKILNRKMDEILENEYIKYLDEDYDDTHIDDNKVEYEVIYDDGEYKGDAVYNVPEEDLSKEESEDDYYDY